MIAFVGLVGLQFSPAARQWAAGLSPLAQGAAGALIAAAAFPLAWPAYIAIGLYESGLAERVRTGDEWARVTAVRIVRAQAGVFGVVGAAAVGLAIAFREANGSDYLALAWLPFTVVATLHLWTARLLRRDVRDDGADDGTARTNVTLNTP